MRAWLAGWLVFVPAPFLLLGFILPALAWLAALRARRAGARRRGSRRSGAALARAWRLARADYVHVLGSLATLAILVLVTQGVLAFIIRGAAAEALETAVRARERRHLAARLHRRGAPLRGSDRPGSSRFPAWPIYILLSRLSQQGVATLKSNPDRLREVNRDVEELGAKVLHQWATLGEFDFVNVVEAPDTATIARVSVALGARGSTKIQTLPALTIDDFVATLS